MFKALLVALAFSGAAHATSVSATIDKTPVSVESVDAEHAKLIVGGKVVFANALKSDLKDFTKAINAGAGLLKSPKKSK